MGVVLTRRLTVHRVRGLIGLLASAAVLLACSGPAHHDDAAPSASGAGSPSAATSAPPTWPSAEAVAAENAQPGDASYNAGIEDVAPTSVEGYAERTSIAAGEQVGLRLHSTEGAVTVTAYRLGFYDGAGARKVWTSQPVTAVDQPEPTFDAATRTTSAAGWSTSTTLNTTGWPPGSYVLRLVGAAGTPNLIPITLRAPSTEGAVVILNADTTWQAYNTWGGHSLYHGPKGGASDRAYAVSFDRPYSLGGGAAGLLGDEAPLIRLVESLTVPVAYITDTDLHADPTLLEGAAAVLTPGHDEYYSTAMRDNLTAARDSGTNIAFFGANAIYRHIRLEPTPVGPNRLEIGYKDGSIDPIRAVNPDEATYQWRSGPNPRPESVLTGVYYQCNPVHDDMVVASPQSWVLSGTGLKAGDVLPGQVGEEYDQVTPLVPTPRPMEVVFHSQVVCRGVPQHADAVYYTVPSGAGVFAAGTTSWVCGLEADCPPRGEPDQATADLVRAITGNVVLAFAAGPAGTTHPATDNLDALKISAATVTQHPSS
jgi:hypothetical protein